MLNKKILLPILALGGILSATVAKAIPCAVCTIAVGASVGLARWLKIDDRITGLWVGALIASLIAWTIHYLDKKNIRFKGRKILTVILWYGLTIVPFFFTGMIGHPLNKVWGIDRLFFGIVLGTIIFIIANLLLNYLKKKNNGKSYFHLQKAIVPVGFLAIASLITYLIIR
ncbi:MAG: hypothetical protein Q7R99_02850 [bacterium]|nr:hypothetical protein [bacterium]